MTDTITPSSLSAEQIIAVSNEAQQRRRYEFQKEWNDMGTRIYNLGYAR